MTELFYWKEIERRARAAQALAMLHNRKDMDGINQANAILDELCLDRRGAERLIRSRMPRRPGVAMHPPALQSLIRRAAVDRRPQQAHRRGLVGHLTNRR